jgi:hypothetical protein
MEIVKRDPRGQGDQGERSAMLWFGEKGAAVFMPVFHSPISTWSPIGGRASSGFR